MQRALLVILIFAAILSGGCSRFSSRGSPEEQAARKIKDAEALSEARDYQRAADLYEEAIRLHPANADAHFKVAVIYDKKLDQFLAAIYHYDTFLRLEPETERSKLASEFLNNVHFQYVSTLPQFRQLANPDMARMQTENDALHRQISELKTELVRVRAEKGHAAPPTAAIDASPPKSPSAGTRPSPAPKPAPVAAAQKKPAAAPKKPTPAAPATAPIANTYRVQQGEGLQTIALKVYGDRGEWRRILKANPQLSGPGDLKAGQVLRIP